MEYVLALQQLSDGIGPEGGEETQNSTASGFCSTQSNNCVDAGPGYQVI
jgi:hypothetical protein